MRKQSVFWKCTTEKNKWADMPTVAATDYLNTKESYIYVNPDTRYQIIDGWGGCFNERGWDAMSVLPEAERNGIIKAFFDPAEGCKINFGRVPMGASDYSMDYYTYNDIPGDYRMEQFSIARDKKFTIPYIRAAKAVRPDLKLWAVPWIHPKWLEGEDGNLTKDPKALDAYALYYSKFIRAYRNEGLDLFCVMPHNEPCWDDFWGANRDTAPGNAAPMLNLLKNHIIPRFQKDLIDCEIWLGSFPISGEYDFICSMMSDPAVAPHIKGAGFQWWAGQAMLQTHIHYPELNLMQTETACNLVDLTVEDLANRKNTNDWDYGHQQWELFQYWLERYCNSYMLWNLVLDETGKNNSTGDDAWPQCSPVIIDKKTGKITYTPQFYAFKHYSYFIEPGARRIQTDGNWKDKIAFINPNGDIILEAANSRYREYPVAINIGGIKIYPALPPHSWNTFLLPANQV